jgi:transposase
MSKQDMFGAVPEGEQKAKSGEERPSGEPRVMSPDRHQMRFMPTDLDSLVDEEHRVRAIWAAVERLDLSEFEDAILARGEAPGRPAIDPKILVALWLYGTSEGVGSAREVARLCEEHNVYRWICGGVGVNYHALSDFRVGHREALDGLMTQVLAVLTHEGLVDLKRVAQDRMRVRASAGAASFRREPSLKKCLEEAKRQVEEVGRETPEGEVSARQAARRERAVRAGGPISTSGR